MATAVPDAVRDALQCIAGKRLYRRPRLEYEVPGALNASDGHIGVLYRAVIRDEDPFGNGARTRVVCKTTANAEDISAFHRHMFVIEAAMYNTVLPALAEVAGLRQPLPWPRLLHSSVVGATAPCIALADLRPEGFSMADRRSPLDLAHCRVALTELARFHGAGLALRHLRPEEHEAVLAALLPSQLHFQTLVQMFGGLFESFRNAPDLVLDRFPEGSEGRSKLVGIFGNIVEYYSAMRAATSIEADSAFLHGDCHTNNMMFQYDKATGAVTGCRLIDFQTSRAGRTAWDLATFLLPCTDRALRAAHWDGLLRHYHCVLQDTLRAAGCEDPDAVFSWEQFQDCLRHASHVGLCMAPLLLHVMFSDAEDAQELRHVLAEVDKVEKKEPTAEPRTSLTIKAKPELTQRFGDIVQDMLDWEWL